MDISLLQILAFGLVAFYAWSRFNTPPTVRTQTSRIQYLASGIFYVMSCEGVLVITTWVFQVQPELLKILAGETVLSDEVMKLAPPLVGALILTTLLPSVPFLRDIDGKILVFFHRLGSIPIAASLWVQRMRESKLVLSTDMLEDAKNYVKANGGIPDQLIGEFELDPAKDNLRYDFTRIVILYSMMTRMPAWIRFRTNFIEDPELFDKKLKAFFAQSTAYFIMDRQFKDGPNAIPADASKTYSGICHEIFNDLLILLARVLLYSSKSETQMTQNLRRLGFGIEPSRRILLPTNSIIFNAIGVVVLFVSVAVIRVKFFPHNENLNLSRALAVGAIVALNHSIAAIFAILPKEIWPFANLRTNPSNERPAIAYVYSAVFTFTIAAAVSSAFYFIRAEYFPSWRTLPFTDQLKWVALPTTLSFVLAFCCDNGILRDREPGWLRWAEGLSIGGLLAGMGAFVMFWMNETRPLGFVIMLSASIGILFGSTIPTWYRRSVRGSTPLVTTAYDKELGVA